MIACVLGGENMHARMYMTLGGLEGGAILEEFKEGMNMIKIYCRKFSNNKNII